MGQIDSIWRLPTGIQAVDEISRDLSQGVSQCIIAASLGDIAELERAIYYELQMQQGLSVSSVYLSELPKITPAALQTAVNGTNGNTTLEQLILSELTPAVTVLKGFHGIEPALQKETMTIIRRWADFCHASSAQKSLCIVIPGDAVDGIGDVHVRTTRLKIRCLIGVPSALEIQLLCRTQSGNEFVSAEAHWRELLVSSLAGGDLDLASLLWQNDLADLDNLMYSLQEYAESRCWQRSVFEKQLAGWSPLPKGVRPQWPQHREKMKLLHRQATVYTPEYGEEIHAAVLALLGRSDELEQRVWRSQMSLVLPMIDELRRKVFHLLDPRIICSQEEDNIPEIGELKYTLDQLPLDSAKRQQFYDIVRHARDIRNKLAHMKMISFHEYMLLWHSWQRINRMNIPIRT